MNNYTIQQGTLDGVSNQAVVAGTVVKLVITPDPGYYIDASTFTARPPLPSEVNNVTFVNNGDPTQLSNTVNAAVELNAFTPTGDTSINIDIDATEPLVEYTPRSMCFKSKWAWTGSHTVTHNSINGVTRTEIEAGDASNPSIYKFNSSTLLPQQTLVFHHTFTADASFHYEDISATVQTSGGFAGEYEVTVTETTTSGVITAFDVRVYYTPPIDLEDEPSCDDGHLLLIDYQLMSDIGQAPLYDILSVTAPASIGWNYREGEIKVKGTAGSTYTIGVQNETTSDWYDWNNGWTATPTSKSVTMDSSGLDLHYIAPLEASNDVNFDIILTSTGGTTFAPTIPTSAGDMQITQYGIRTLALQTHTEVPVNFGSMSLMNIVRPRTFTGNSTIGVTALGNATCSNGGSSYNATIESSAGVIQPGMKVANDGSSVSTEITYADASSIIFSEQIDLSTARELQFYDSTPALVSFSFTVEPGAGKTLNVNTSNEHVTSVFGFSDVETKVDGATAGGNPTFVVDDSIGILENMSVIGPSGIPVGRTVSDVDYRTHTITLNGNHTGLSDDERVTFYGANNPDVEVLFVQAEKVGVDILISGFLKINTLENNAKGIVFLDDIITVT